MLSDLPRNVSSHSEYLPFTLPKHMYFPHKTDEFNVLYRTNELGYRGPFPKKIEKNKQTFRLLINGDSFSFGWGNNWQDTYVAHLQSLLSDSSQDPIEVITAGFHNGLSPGSYYAYLKKEGLKLKPDAIFWLLYSWNDVSQDMADNIWVRKDKFGGPTKVLTTRHYTNSMGTYIKRHTDIFGWYYGIPVLRESRFFLGLISQLPGGPQPKNWLSGSELKLEAWEKFRTLCSALRKLSHEVDIPIYFAVLPYADWLHPGVYSHQKIVSIVKESGFDVLDLKPYLKRSHFYSQDKHLTPKGNKQIANHLYQYLTPHLFSSP